MIISADSGERVVIIQFCRNDPFVDNFVAKFFFD